MPAFGTCQTFHCDMPISGHRHLALTQRLFSNGAAWVFSKAIIARYRNQQGRRTSLDLTFWKWPLNLIISRIYPQFHLNVSAMDQGLCLYPLKVNGEEVDQTLSKEDSQPSRRDSINLEITERTVRQLVTRMERLDILSSAKVAPSPVHSFRGSQEKGDPGFISHALPVPRIVRQQKQSEIPSGNPSSGHEQGNSPSLKRPTPMGGPFAGDANGLNLNVLTDQVVRAIDRRVTAYRERTGKA